FLKRFGLLYLSTEDTRTILDRVQKRVAWERRNANPLLGLVEEEREPPPPLDFSDIEAEYADKLRSANFRKGYYQTPDGRLLALLVRPPESGTGYQFSKALWEAVKGEVNRLDPRRYDPTIQVGYDGEVAAMVEEQNALVADLASSTVVVLSLVLASLWIYFRDWRAIAAILGALMAGCGGPFGLRYLLLGHL